MAGLMSGGKSFPFMYKGLATDCMAASSGWWITNDNTTNLPVNSYKFGLLIVFYTYDNFEVRIFVNNNSDRKIYVKTAGVSIGWKDF